MSDLRKSTFLWGKFDFHKLTLTVVKAFHAKYKHKMIQYRDFNIFDNALFGVDPLPLHELSLQNDQPVKLE